MPPSVSTQRKLSTERVPSFISLPEDMIFGRTHSLADHTNVSKESNKDRKEIWPKLGAR